MRASHMVQLSTICGKLFSSGFRICPRGPLCYVIWHDVQLPASFPHPESKGSMYCDFSGMTFLICLSGCNYYSFNKLGLATHSSRKPSIIVPLSYLLWIRWTCLSCFWPFHCYIATYQFCLILSFCPLSWEVGFVTWVSESLMPAFIFCVWYVITKWMKPNLHITFLLARRHLQKQNSRNSFTVEFSHILSTLLSNYTKNTHFKSIYSLRNLPCHSFTLAGNYETRG